MTGMCERMDHLNTSHEKNSIGSGFLFALLVMMQSCQKDLPQSEVIKEITIDTAITMGTDFYFDLAPMVMKIK
jgi:hypothetical protein